MATAQNPSIKTKSALNILHEKKLDSFAKIVVFVFAITFFILEVTLLSALSGKTAWPLFLEFNGVALSMFGALWTALGVRMSSSEKDALLSIKGNAAIVSGEIINTLGAGSRFATFGAYCIMVGGIFLCAKIWLFH